MGIGNAAPRGASMKDSNPREPVATHAPHRVELVRPTYQPSKAELEDSIILPQSSPTETARRLIEPVDIHYIDKPGARARRDALGPYPFHSPQLSPIR